MVKDKNESKSILNNDLLSVTKWDHNGKMLFNPDPTKPAQEVIFFKGKKILPHPVISLNNIQVGRVLYQKHLGILLDEKLDLKRS